MSRASTQIANAARRRGIARAAAMILAAVACSPAIAADDSAAQGGIRCALAFLAHEVPAWPQHNRCFSCHNNGDGARALLVARRRGWDVPDAALAETTEWLLHPQRWETTGGNPDYSDRRLVNVQFSAALSALTAVEQEQQRRVDDSAATQALARAALVLAELQFPDGSWAFEAEGQIGSPIGFGRPLMTVIARDVLSRAGEQRFAGEITRAGDWLRRAEPRTVLDAAAVLWGLAGRGDATAQASIERRLETIRQGQSERGGWGPYRIGAPEPFDTAVVVLALSKLPPTDETQRMLDAGRAFLLATQLPSGAWLATTRPPGVESYPQLISTTAWATLALVMTHPPIDQSTD